MPRRPPPLVVVLDDLHAADEPSLLLLRFLAARSPTADCSWSVRSATLIRRCEIRWPRRWPSSRESRRTLISRSRVERGRRGGIHRAVQRDSSRASARRGGPRRTEGNRSSSLSRAPTGAEGHIADPDAHLRIPPGSVPLSTSAWTALRALPSLLARLGHRPRVRGWTLLAGSARFLATSCWTLWTRRRPSAHPWARCRDRPIGLLRPRIIRDTLYDELSPARRMQLHQDAAEALEAVHSDDVGPHLTELTHHYVAAAPVRWPTGPSSARAAPATRPLPSSRTRRPRASTRWRSRWSRSPPRAATSSSCLGTFARGLAIRASKPAFSEAAELAEEHGLSERLARAALGYGGRIIWERHQDDEYIIPVMERALAALGKEEQPAACAAARAPCRRSPAQRPVSAAEEVPKGGEALNIARRRWATSQPSRTPSPVPSSPSNRPTAHGRRSIFPRSCSMSRSGPATRNASSRPTSTATNGSSSWAT